MNNPSYIVKVLALIAILALVLAALVFNEFKIITFKSISESDIAALVTSMFVVAVFMERAIEAILVPLRMPAKQEIEHEIRRLKEHESESDNKIKELENELAKYKLGTATRANWISFVFGLLISLVGIRVLGGLVDLDTLENAPALQKNLFSFVDVILTGGVVAGGSAAIDQIGRKISNTFHFKSATNNIEK